LSVALAELADLSSLRSCHFTPQTAKSEFLTICGVACNITVGMFHAAPRLARKAAAAARRTAKVGGGGAA